MLRNIRRIDRMIAHGFYLLILHSPFECMVRVRAFLLNVMTKNFMPGLVVRPGVYVIDYRNFTFGRNLSINHNCFVSCGGGLSIGDNVSIAHGVTIMTTEHGYGDSDTPMKFQPIQRAAVVIGDDVWVGAKATILAGVSLPRGTIVAAGAVVTRSPESEDSIIGGVPARIIKGRF